MSKIITDSVKIDDLFGRYVENVYPSKEKAKEFFMSGKRLSFYLGIDPTGPDIHLGHSTNLLLLKKIINLGHRGILLIGGFTARVGDPTGKISTRRSLSEKEVKKNMKSYVGQACKILVKGSFEVNNNSSWLKKMTFDDLIKLTSHFSVQQMIARDMFQERIKNQKPIFLHEFLYPIMQGYDSVAMKIDGEIGGADQTFNMLVGRELEKELLNKDKLVITTKLLEDPQTGKKIMNKSEGRYVSLNDKPREMFGKIMSMPDSAIIPIFENTTEVSLEKIKEIKAGLDKGGNPKKAKEELAYELVGMYYGEKKAQLAAEEFKKVFSEKGLPEEIGKFLLNKDGVDIVNFLTDWLAISKSQAKTYLNQKAVSVNNRVVSDWGHKMRRGDIVKVGPRRFVKVE